MADNRKKKPNYADALAAPAKSSPAQEQIEVDVGGEVVPILRGDMTDAQWAAVKKRALPKGSDVSLKSKELGWSDLMSLGQNLDGVADTVVSKEQKDLLKKTDEWTRAEYLRQRFRQQGYTVPPNSAEDERASYKDGKKAPPVDVGAKKPDQGSPEEWKAMPAAKPQPQSAPGTQTEDDAMVGSAGPGMSPRANMMQMALAANPKGEQTLTGQSTEEIDRDLANVKAQGERHGQEDLAALKRAGEFAGVVPTGEVLDPYTGKMTAPEPVVDGLKDSEPAKSAFGGSTLRALGNFVGYEPKPSEQQMAAREDLGLDPVNGELPQRAVEPPVAAPQPPPQDQGQGSFAASIAGMMPGGFRVEKADPAAKSEYDKARAAARAQIENAQDTMEALNIARDGAVREASKRQMVVEEENAKLATLASQAKMNSVQEARRIQAAQASVVEEARRAAADPTDPNRYWNSKSEGQRAAAVIAGALFGWGGQGMQWLQRLDGLVEADMNAQRADRASKVQGLNAKASYLGQAAQQAIANGATEAEAMLLERQSKIEGLKAYLDTMTLKLNNMDQKTRAMQMSAELGMKSAALGEQAYALAQQTADKKTEWNYKNAALAQDKVSTMAKIAAKGEGGVKFSPGEVGRLDAARQGLEAVKLLKQTLGPESSVGKALYDEVTKRGGQLTEAGRRQKAVEPQRRTIIRLIDASAIQKADAEYWKDKISNVGLDNMSQSDLDALTKFFASQHDAVVKTRQSLGSYAGSETQDFPETPAE